LPGPQTLLTVKIMTKPLKAKIKNQNLLVRDGYQVSRLFEFMSGKGRKVVERKGAPGG